MRVLIVEDNNLLRHHLTVQLRELGHQVDAAEDSKKQIIFFRKVSRISQWLTSVCPARTAW